VSSLLSASHRQIKYVPGALCVMLVVVEKAPLTARPDRTDLPESTLYDGPHGAPPAMRTLA